MTTLSSAALRSASTVAASALNRYRPVGVARIGSAEDRAQAYRRFLEAAYHVDWNLTWFRELMPIREANGGDSRDLIYRLLDAQAEMNCAMAGVRLCGSVYVIAAAEAVVKALPDPKDDDDVFEARSAEFLGRATYTFLNAARRDLAYTPRWWQLLRKRKERKFREAQAGIVSTRRWWQLRRRSAVSAGEAE
ncbi:hypothetical protein [Streptomyces sp. NPDC087307]|uniref:hypothetical protein n=1 Tax=Streptomyces sp. NPDC087307 TaxID=3365782 RepID=UPI00382D3D3A